MKPKNVQNFIRVLLFDVQQMPDIFSNIWLDFLSKQNTNEEAFFNGRQIGSRHFLETLCVCQVTKSSFLKW